MTIRKATEADFDRITGAIEIWWDSPEMNTEAARRERAALVPRLYLQHFTDTCLVIDGAQGIQGFLIGFLSPQRPNEGYIHFVGVAPDARGEGIGRRLYSCFFDICRADGRGVVRCITSPGNTQSIAYHQAMGFKVEIGDALREGVSFKSNYDGPGLDRVAFVRKIGTQQHYKPSAI